MIETAITQFAADVLAGLTRPGQKELPSKYLYDALGSRLFDAITELPEYGLTRAETRILERHAGEIVTRLPEEFAIAELGSGSGKKTRFILEALQRPALYYPIEISPTALALCERELSDLKFIGIVGVESEYLEGLNEVVERRLPGHHLLVLFLGSTIGNFEQDAALRFLREVRRLLIPGDALLLATDLIKPERVLLNAYDDPLGVTAAFNLNLLSRVNRELEAGFDLSRFRHEARFNNESSSIEMHLRSLRDQMVNIHGTKVFFSEGETIWTESCHKYRLNEAFDMGHAAGFRGEARWIDREWGFAENLLIAE